PMRASDQTGHSTMAGSMSGLLILGHFFLFSALHGRCVGVLHLEPIRRAAGTVGRFPLRHDAFEAELARVAKHGLAVAVHVLIESDAPASLARIISSVAFRPSSGSNQISSLLSSIRSKGVQAILFSACAAGMLATYRTTASPGRAQ